MLRSRSQAGVALPPVEVPSGPAPVAPEAGRNPGSVPRFDPAPTGTPVSVTWGKELFQAMPFNTFEVGPFGVTTLTREGESISEATLRVYAELDYTARAIRRQKTTGYIEHLAEIARQVDAPRR